LGVGTGTDRVQEQRACALMHNCVWWVGGSCRARVGAGDKWPHMHNKASQPLATLCGTYSIAFYSILSTNHSCTTMWPLAKPAGHWSSADLLAPVTRLPVLTPVIGEAAGQPSRSSVIPRPAGACHHSLQSPPPEWSWRYSMISQLS